MKIFARLFKGGEVKERRSLSRFAKREILMLQKTQEGRKNYPVDDFSVGNPRRGFPYAKHQKSSISAFLLFGIKFVRNKNILQFSSFSVLRT